VGALNGSRRAIVTLLGIDDKSWPGTARAAKRSSLALDVGDRHKADVEPAAPLESCRVSHTIGERLCGRSAGVTGPHAKQEAAAP
jgi:hypothetical protein